MARLKSARVPLEWHEAVAAVQDVVQLVKEGGYASPAAEQLTVGPDGTLSIVSPRAGKSRGDQSPQVRGLGHLLKDLLGEVRPPAQLALLAEEAVADPPKFMSVDDFSWQLSFFERPERRAVLAEAAARLIASEEQARIEAEMEGLTRKARQPEPPPPAEKGASKTRDRRRVLAFAAAILLVVAAVLVMAALRSRPEASTLASGSEAIVEAGGRLVDAIKTRAQAVLGAETTPEPEATATEATRSPVAKVEPKARPASPAPQGTSGQDQPTAGLQTAPFLLSRVMIPDPQDLLGDQLPGSEESGPELGGHAVGTVDPDAVFGPDDDSIVPPELVRPQLPAVPGAGVPTDTLSVIEILVSNDGSVDQVRLVANPASRRYYAAMLVAAVKTWKFRPATNGDTPVRYRLRMALTQ